MTDHPHLVAESLITAQIDPSLAGRHLAFIGQLQPATRGETLDRLDSINVQLCDAEDPRAEIVVVCEDLPIGTAGSALNDDLVQAAGEGQLEMISESELLQRLGLDDAENMVRSLYTPAMLADLLDVSVSTIRSWQRRGLIRPERQINKLSYFDFQEITVAKQLAQLVAAGVSAKAIEKNLARLTSWLPDVSRPLAQLSVLVEGKQILLRQGGGLVDTDGQKRFDFELIENHDQSSEYFADHLPSISIESSSAQPDSILTPAQFIELAEQFEAGDQIDQAIEAYRSLHLAHGVSADTCFRLGELLYLNGELQAARERYYNAIELDARFVEARASLGCVLVELDQPELAISAFQGALELHQDYPDVHFHLARTYDIVDQPSQAAEHWRRFIELAPHSPWATEARERLVVISELPN